MKQIKQNEYTENEMDARTYELSKLYMYTSKYQIKEYTNTNSFPKKLKPHIILWLSK